MTRRWPPILFLWLVGILAAAQLAKFSTMAPLLRARFDLSLPATGLLISLMEVGGGVLGFGAGLALSWISRRQSLVAGLALLALTGVVEAEATSATTLFAARAAEGIGYLLVVIAAPTAIAALADDVIRPRALALWSSFVPMGIAIGAVLTGYGVDLVQPRGVMLGWSIVLALAIVPVLRLPLGHSEACRIMLPAPAAWVSTLAFGVYTLFLCSLTMLLPTFLIDERGASVGEAGLVASLASLSALPASGIAMALIRKGPMSLTRLFAICGPSLVLTAGLAPLVFAGPSGLVATSVVVVLAVLLSGLVSPLVFARLPLLAGARSPHDPRIAAANGLITQFGAGGALVGPPLAGLVVRHWGWGALGLTIAALALVMLVLIALAEALGTRPRPRPSSRC
ncbi:MFS transporter [Novosphingobium sp. 1949]|uniref:MFS transporter n=1 Tax=Novosphingobium organovorum TaxID=2930092 RepID=A0ABT0B9U4_9SPHN|nr:MFS transporter [Novosphingobium organovorum]MCJ2181778.1 MFS transporter [Novosphingobium organovorum]